LSIFGKGYGVGGVPASAWVPMSPLGAAVCANATAGKTMNAAATAREIIRIEVSFVSIAMT
jgi:hypothetical protein